MENEPRTQRRQAFVDAARESFLANGYAATTMSAIAAVVGGSKTTLWSYFPSKEALLSAVLDDLAEQYCAALTVELDPAAPIERELRRFAVALMDTIYSPPMLAMQRVVVAEAARCPELGEMVYERGPRRGKARFAAFLAAAMEAGKIRPGDSLLAARQFGGLCQAGLYQEAMFGVRAPDPVSIEQTMDAALDTFLRAWGVAKPAPTA